MLVLKWRLNLRYVSLCEFFTFNFLISLNAYISVIKNISCWSHLFQKKHILLDGSTFIAFITVVIMIIFSFMPTVGTRIYFVLLMVKQACDGQNILFSESLCLSWAEIVSEKKKIKVNEALNRLASLVGVDQRSRQSWTRSRFTRETGGFAAWAEGGGIKRCCSQEKCAGRITKCPHWEWHVVFVPLNINTTSNFPLAWKISPSKGVVAASYQWFLLRGLWKAPMISSWMATSSAYYVRETKIP